LLEVPAGGGLDLFENINALTISHVNSNGINDGFDLTFQAISASVPEPGTLLLLGSSLDSGIVEMAAAYLFHLVKNHPFGEGNKGIGTTILQD